MAKITTETQYRNMQVGDIMPDGSVVVRISRSMPGDREHSTTRIMLLKNKREITYGAERSSETYGQAVERAEAMHRLEDHS